MVKIDPVVSEFCSGNKPYLTLPETKFKLFPWQQFFIKKKYFNMRPLNMLKGTSTCNNETEYQIW